MTTTMPCTFELQLATHSIVGGLYGLDHSVTQPAGEPVAKKSIHPAAPAAITDSLLEAANACTSAVPSRLAKLWLEHAHFVHKLG